MLYVFNTSPRATAARDAARLASYCCWTAVEFRIQCITVKYSIKTTVIVAPIKWSRDYKQFTHTSNDSTISVILGIHFGSTSVTRR